MSNTSRFSVCPGVTSPCVLTGWAAYSPPGEPGRVQPIRAVGPSAFRAAVHLGSVGSLSLASSPVVIWFRDQPTPASPAHVKARPVGKLNGGRGPGAGQRSADVQLIPFPAAVGPATRAAHQPMHRLGERITHHKVAASGHGVAAVSASAPSGTRMPFFPIETGHELKTWSEIEPVRSLSSPPAPTTTLRRRLRADLVSSGNNSPARVARIRSTVYRSRHATGRGREDEVVEVEWSEACHA